MTRENSKLPAVIHSSLKEVRRLGTDSDFPAHTPSIGALIRLNHFGGAVLETHTPKLSSLVEGEVFECDMSDLDTELRVRLKSIASMCRSLSSELLEHATQLEYLALPRCNPNLIDRPESPESEVQTLASGIGETTRSESPSKSRTRTPAPDLSLFD